MLKLSAIMCPPGVHSGGWRHPDAVCDAAFNFDHWVDFAKLAERGKLDMIFLADTNSVAGIEDLDVFDRDFVARPAAIEPVTLLSAMSTVTSRIGFIASGTTTYDEPYSLARRYAALDWVSKGRAGWNVVTGAFPADAKNFSRDEHMEHGARYERAHEFVDVVKDLWDSWADDAPVLDKANGIYVDGRKIRPIDHKGKHFSVKGPLNSGRPPQGHPVIVVAGGSDPGLELAARTADMLFIVVEGKEAAQHIYADVKGRMIKYGRSPNDLKVMPGVSIFAGPTTEDADALYRQLQGLVPESVGISVLSSMVGVDLREYPIDGPLPDLPATQGVQTFRKVLADLSKNGFTIRQLYQHILPARGHVVMKGNPAQVADVMEEWYRDKACDGFNLAIPYMPGGLERIVDLVIPELRRRGLFRTEYEGTTLRESLGIERPGNRFFA